MKKLFLISIITLANLIFGIMAVYSQSAATTCANAAPFCAGTVYTFPMDTGTTGETGPNYGCLYTYPNPVWYYFKIANPGNITIFISGGANDVDFACWGPFTSPVAECDTGLTAGCDWAGNWSATNPCPDNTTSPNFYPSGNMVDCSYDPSSTENCHILNALTGQYYMLCITNYANVPGNLTFSLAGGNATTDCGIVAPPIKNNGPLCIGDTLKLNVTNPVANAIYSWTGPNGFTSSAMNPFIANVTTANAGVYSLIITVDTVSSSPVTTTVVVYPNPDVKITAPNPICPGTSTSLAASGAVTYSWSNNLGTGNPVSVTPPVNTAYTVTGTDAHGCKDTAKYTIYIIVDSLMRASITGDSLVCSKMGEQATIKAITSGGHDPYTYSWLPDTSYHNSIISVTPTQTTLYYVTVTDSCGHKASSNAFTVKTECPVIIPNVFTPNSDNVNDVFFITNLDEYPNSELIIFNRWGKIVYQNSDYQNNWDGTKHSDGTYFYILTLNNGKRYHGILTIIK